MDKEKFFKEYNKEQPKDFFIALGFSQNGYYSEAITLYEKILEEDKDDFVTLCNLGYANMMLGVKEKDTELLQTSIAQLEKAIIMADEVYGKKDSYSIAIGNLKDARNELAKLK